MFDHRNDAKSRPPVAAETKLPQTHAAGWEASATLPAERPELPTEVLEVLPATRLVFAYNS